MCFREKEDQLFDIGERGDSPSVISEEDEQEQVSAPRIELKYAVFVSVERRTTKKTGEERSDEQ